MAAFVRKDSLSYDDVRQSIQELVYNLNVPSRWGTQTPFTNLTFDWTCPEDLAGEYPVIGGVVQEFTYGELQAEMDLINRAYIEVMTAGDAKGRVFTFPIPTYNITPEFPWESENATLLFEMTAKYGLPYFQNFLNSELKPNMVRSMCCRLQLDLTELLKRGNGLFGSAEQTGSLGVVTINCARLGHLYAGDETALYAALDTLLELSRTSLELKRKVIQHHIDGGLFPYTKRYLGTLRNHFSTIGVNGINEMIRNFTGDAYDITTPEGHAMAVRFLDHVREQITRFQEETGHLYNLEATPAEGTTYRFAREDNKRYPGHPAGRHRGQPVLHELLAAARRLHRRPLRGAHAPGGAAAQVHRRHRAAPLHGRAGLLGGGVQEAREALAGELPPALHHHHAHVLGVPGPRVPRGRVRVLPEVRRGARRNQAPRRRILLLADPKGLHHV